MSNGRECSLDMSMMVERFGKVLVVVVCYYYFVEKSLGAQRIEKSYGVARIRRRAAAGLFLIMTNLFCWIEEMITTWRWN